MVCRSSQLFRTVVDSIFGKFPIAIWRRMFGDDRTAGPDVGRKTQQGQILIELIIIASALMTFFILFSQLTRPALATLKRSQFAGTTRR